MIGSSHYGEVFVLRFRFMPFAFPFSEMSHGSTIQRQIFPLASRCAVVFWHLSDADHVFCFQFWMSLGHFTVGNHPSSIFDFPASYSVSNG